jgi:hypothetical protein
VKLILGLIWTLICHYQIDDLQIDLDEPEIKTPRKTEEEIVQDTNKPTENKPPEKPKKKEKKKKGKELLIAWLQRQTSDYDNVTVKDLTTSFKNGLLLCALVDSVNPNLINYKNLDPVKNFSLFKRILNFFLQS